MKIKPSGATATTDGAKVATEWGRVGFVGLVRVPEGCFVAPCKP